jgi:hypothetical protein
MIRSAASLRANSSRCDLKIKTQYDAARNPHIVASTERGEIRPEEVLTSKVIVEPVDLNQAHRDQAVDLGVYTSSSHCREAAPTHRYSGLPCADVISSE